MKISLNLASNPGFHERYALKWSAPTASVGLVVLLLLAHSLWRNYDAYRAVHAKVEADTREQAKLQQDEARLKHYLEQPQYSGTFREVQFLNALIAEKKVSVPEVIAKATALLPAEARLVRMTYLETPDGRSMHFEVTGKSEEAVETFLSNLEQSPDFADAGVIAQGFDKQNPDGGVILSCRARYVGYQEAQEQ
jgi:hypothetical protein